MTESTTKLIDTLAKRIETSLFYAGVRTGGMDEKQRQQVIVRELNAGGITELINKAESWNSECLCTCPACEELGIALAAMRE